MEGRIIMLNKKIEESLNNQLNMELYSAYIYLSMASYFQSINLSGFAHWMNVQLQEEQTHAIRFYNFINERNGRVTLQQIDKPKIDWSSPLEAFEDALRHEEKVTESINNMVNLAIDNKDHATNIFLQWFVTEQVEEEASVSEVINKLNLMGDNSGLFLVDRELAQRVFVPPMQPEAILK